MRTLNHVGVWIIGCGLLAHNATLFAQAPPVVSAETVKSKHDAQKRAQVMTRELVGGILDLQIEQLEQNGLQTMEIYKEVRAVRENLDGLIDKEMTGVVELLTQAQTGPVAERTQRFNQAREKIRTIVTELAIQRQNLAKRLKVAEIAAQIKRLIELESTVLTGTGKAANAVEAERLQAQVVLIQDQRDFGQMYDSLDQLLLTVGKWSGVVGAGATEAHKFLRAGKIPDEIDASVAALTASELAKAKENEQNIIKTLRQVLDKIQETQGLIGTDREALLQFVREMIRKQKALRGNAKSGPHR
ncbi:MAG: hypothetical protein QM811_13630 [Pirellulales bacterium]